MNMILRRRIRTLLLGAGATSALFAFAASAHALDLLPYCDGDKYRPEAFIVLIFNVVKYLWGLTGSVALAMLIFGGFSLLLAAGDPQKVKGGIGTIRNAIIGILVVLGSWLIINTVVGLLTTGDLPTGQAMIFGSSWSATGAYCY